MKIKCIEKRWIRYGLLITSLLIISVLIYYMIDHFTAKEAESEIEFMKEDDLTYVTKQVIDYTGENGKEKNTWETRYNILKSTSSLYQNNKYKRDIVGADINQVVTFSPEIYPENYSYKEQLIEQKIAGIIYELDLETSEKYVASLLNNRYSMHRKILTSTYAEVYLIDTAGDIIRIFCTNDKMIMAQLEADAPMPSIESYFK